MSFVLSFMLTVWSMFWFADVAVGFIQGQQSPIPDGVRATMALVLLALAHIIVLLDRGRHA